MRASSLVVALAFALAGCQAAKPSVDREPAPSRAANVYVALGDSFTIGTGGTPEQAFPARFLLRQRARGCELGLLNLAKNGYTADEVLARQIPEMGDAPTLVTFSTGANELVRGASEAEYREGLRRALAAIVAHRPKRLVVVPQPDWSPSPTGKRFGEPAALRADIERRNTILHEEATAAHAEYVDLFALMVELGRSGAFADDGLHPSSAAHDAWAAKLDGALGVVCPAP